MPRRIYAGGPHIAGSRVQLRVCSRTLAGCECRSLSSSRTCTEGDPTGDTALGPAFGPVILLWPIEFWAIDFWAIKRSRLI